MSETSETTVKVPRTLREKLMIQREELYETRDVIHKAVMELLGGAAVASYVLGNRSVSKTRANLSELRAALREIDAQIDEIEAILSSRPQRARTVHSYISPSNVSPPFFY